MGNNSSLPPITPDMTDFDAHGKKIESIPEKLPPNKIQTANLEHTGLSDPQLPKSMPFLRSLSLGYNEMTQISPGLVKTLKHYPKLTTLDFQENNIVEVPPNLGSIPQITNLSLFANKLKSFNYSNKHLKILNLGHNALHEIPNIDSKELQRFTFDWNYLTVLDFKKDTLTFLSLVCVGLEKISPNFSFPNLEYLDLKMNRLTSVPNFEITTPKLTFLDVSDNFLTEFPIVPKCIDLLNVKSNNIKDIPFQLPLLTKLKTINFSYNQIDFVPMVPKGIKKIYGVSNKIQNFSASDTPYLTEFNLDNNLLSIMPQIVNNQAIMYNVKHNNIKRINLDYVSKNVVSIELVDNLIETIPKEIFELPSLEKLFLMHNKITEVPPEIQTAKQLKKLNLSFNQIQQMPVLPPNVTEFHIAGNQIKNIPPYIATSGITLLDISLNQIISLPLLPKVTNLYASQNQIKLFPQLSPEIVALDLSYNQLTVLPPLQLPKLVDLDLSHNNIMQLPPITCPSLILLKLAENHNMAGTIGPGIPQLHQLDICNTKIEVINDSKVLIRETLYTNGQKINRSKLLQTGNSSAVAEMRGLRDTQEDSIYIQPRTKHHHSLYCVFDGHGGSLTSLYCTLLVKKFVNDNNFEMTENHIRNQTRNLQKQLEERKYHDGSTMAFAIIENNKVIIAHVGDARVVITDDSGKVNFSTPDHKPTYRSEFERIHASGGRVTKGRVNSILAVARSLGDLKIADSLSPDPDVATYFLHDYEKWLFVCCDGVFDVLSNEYLAKVGASINDPHEMAYTIRNTAFGTNSTDNITCIAVNLHQRLTDPDVI